MRHVNPVLLSGLLERSMHVLHLRNCHLPGLVMVVAEQLLTGLSHTSLSPALVLVSESDAEDSSSASSPSDVSSQLSSRQSCMVCTESLSWRCTHLACPSYFIEF